MSLLKELFELKEQSCKNYIERFINQLREKIKLEPCLNKIYMSFESQEQPVLNERVVKYLSDEGFIVTNYIKYIYIEFPESSLMV